MTGSDPELVIQATGYLRVTVFPDNPDYSPHPHSPPIERIWQLLIDLESRPDQLRVVFVDIELSKSTPPHVSMVRSQTHQNKMFHNRF